MTTPIVLTNEMRQAVHDEDCILIGHDFDTTTMLRGPSVRDGAPPPSGLPVIKVRGPEAGILPHLTCRRCGIVHILMDEKGNDYNRALRKLKKRLVRGDPLHDAPEMT